MKSYVFAMANKPIKVVSASIEAMSENCGNYFPVALEGDDQLKILMDLLGVTLLAKTLLSSNEDFSALFDYSEQRLPQLSEGDFNIFYDEWLRKSGRESSMDEYGQLIFLQGRADEWNKVANRFILCES